jgi:2-dehydro-3-deoxygalactonokinase
LSSRCESIIGIDWGSTSLSAYRIGTDGTLLDYDTIGAGITRVDRAGIAAALAGIATRWAEASTIYISGMIGSPAGWCIAPYLDCPCGITEITSSLLPARIGNIDVFIVPGLRAYSPAGTADVMRGEEVEALGLALALAPVAGDRLVVLPGTHTKWVTLREGEICSFFTAMSGELFDVLRRHSLLGAILVDGDHRTQGFADGVRAGTGEGEGLARLLFGVRAQVLCDQLGPADATSYLRGILIGAEVADAVKRIGGPIGEGDVPLLGNPALCDRYVTAMEQYDLRGRAMQKGPVMARAYHALHQGRISGDARP